MGWDLTILATALVLYASVSRRLSGTVVTPAIVFVGIGYFLGTEGLDVFETTVDSSTVRLLAEVTLALVLFTDASAVSTSVLVREVGVPTRLLTIGLPLTIVAGTGAAILLFPTLNVFEALVLAVLLAPTDAALGQAVVSDTRLPSRLRQGLNVESGLNDGICVTLLFSATAFDALESGPEFDGEILVDLVKEIGIATGVGLVVAVAVSALARETARRDWTDGHWAQLVPLAAAAIAYSTTDELGGSGFIAAFVAGLVYGRSRGPEVTHETTRLTEETAGVLSAVTFFIFGAGVIASAVTDLDLRTLTYAALSLTILRMLPVAVSLIGSGAQLPTVAFAGWFGPRGLATIVFVLTIVDEADLAHTDLLVQVATVTVCLSVVAHGISAPLLTASYLRWFSQSRERREIEASAGVSAPAPRRSIWHRHGPSRIPHPR
jgi:NhaP-type Na+/H+ or K+/H+ antiporter